KKQTVTLKISGMTCSACAARIEKVLNKQAGVEANVNLAMEEASFSYDPDEASPRSIVEAIERLGYQVQVEKVEFDIGGMTCASCANRIEKVLNKQTGVDSAIVNLATESATIQYKAGISNEKDLKETIERLGFAAKVKVDRQKAEREKDKEVKSMQIKLIISAILAFPLLITMLDHLFGIALPSILMNPWFQFALATPIQFVIGWQFYVGAYRSLRSKSANMDVLVVMGTSAAYFFSIYEGIKATTTSGYEAHLYFETS